jgi:hypothetical protein
MSSSASPLLRRSPCDLKRQSGKEVLDAPSVEGMLREDSVFQLRRTVCRHDHHLTGAIEEPGQRGHDCPALPPRSGQPTLFGVCEMVFHDDVLGVNLFGDGKGDTWKPFLQIVQRKLIGRRHVPGFGDQLSPDPHFAGRDVVRPRTEPSLLSVIRPPPTRQQTVVSNRASMLHACVPLGEICINGRRNVQRASVSALSCYCDHTTERSSGVR